MALARIYARVCQVQEKLLEVDSLGGQRIYVHAWRVRVVAFAEIFGEMPSWREGYGKK